MAQDNSGSGVVLLSVRPLKDADRYEAVVADHGEQLTMVLDRKSEHGITALEGDQEFSKFASERIIESSRLCKTIFKMAAGERVHFPIDLRTDA